MFVIVGSLPNFIASQTWFLSFKANNNRFSGRVNLTQAFVPGILKELYLQYNGFTGPLPELGPLYNGMEQFVRDGRINQTYEGANGVQAMDLVGRKLGRRGGTAPMALFGAIGGWISENDNDPALQSFVKPLARGLDTLQRATMWLAQNGLANPNNAGAGAVDFLRLMGIVVVGWMWAQIAKLTQKKLDAKPANADFYKRKLTAANYWMERMMPECPMLLERIESGADTIMAFDETID